MSAALDYAAGGEAGYTGLPGDRNDTAQMAPFTPTDAGMPWWQGLAVYGITRAIDNRLGPPTVQGNVQPGSFGGANGRTYSNNPTGQGGTVSVAGMGIPTWALIAAVGVVGYLALNRG